MNPRLTLEFSPEGELVAVFLQAENSKQEDMLRGKLESIKGHVVKYDEYFQIGVSEDYILIRDDFPLESVSPGDFSKLCQEMFHLNEEALKSEK